MKGEVSNSRADKNDRPRKENNTGLPEPKELCHGRRQAAPLLVGWYYPVAHETQRTFLPFSNMHDDQ